MTRFTPVKWTLLHNHVQYTYCTEKEPVLAHTFLVRTCLLPVPIFVTTAPYNFTNINSQNQSTNVKRRLNKYNQLKTLFLAVLRERYVATQGKNVANTVFAYLHCTKSYIFNCNVNIEQSMSISNRMNEQIDVIISSLTMTTRN